MVDLLSTGQCVSVCCVRWWIDVYQVLLYCSVKEGEFGVTFRFPSEVNGRLLVV